MSAKDTAESFAIGAIIAVVLVVTTLFYPALIISLSIVDIMFEDGSSEAVFYGIIIFMILSTIIGIMFNNIRTMWGILAILYISCAYPFYHWMVWLFTESAPPFPGVNWLPGF